MPVALLLRIFLRFAGALIFWRVATLRRGAYGGRRQPVRGAAPPERLDARERVANLREGVSLAWRLTALVVLFGAAALLVAAGIGPAVLGPRWLGIALLVLAAAAVGGAALDGIAVQRVFALRTKRRHDKDLTRQVYP